MMPQLEMTKVTEILKKLQSKDGLANATEILQDEQDQEFISQILYATMVNPDIMRGFILCYLAVREKLTARSISELEMLFKL